jgi:hypothetical protein
MSRSPLYEYIGDPIVICSTNPATDGLAASDCAAGVQNMAYEGILFLHIVGGGDSDWAGTIQFQYSSTGSASDAVTSNATMTCTDMVGSTVNNTDSGGNVKIIDVSIHEKAGVGDYAGKWFVSMAAAETGSVVQTVVGIPYGGTVIYPATNAEAAVYAKA